MIAVDTSSMVAYLQGQKGADIEILEDSLRQGITIFPPVVFTELLSDPSLSLPVRTMLNRISLLSTDEGYWERAGMLRARLRQKGYRAKVADSLIAQSCIDHNTSLITRDRDFRNFKGFGLKLLS